MIDNTTKLSFQERLGAWLIVCFFCFLTLFNIYLDEPKLPKETGKDHYTGISLIEVIIKGAVKHPGVYQVQKGTLVKDVLALASPLENANLKRIKQQNKILRRRTIHIREN